MPDFSPFPLGSLDAPRLVSTITADGLRLDGAWQVPPASQVDLSQPALLLLHGTGSNFYAPGPLETLAGRAATAGLTALRANTRGHDGMSSIPGSPRGAAGGASFETVSECPLDVAAWLDALCLPSEPEMADSKRLPGIVLAGHSMGAVKAIYSQAIAPDPRVRGIVCLSPPRFCHQHWMQHSSAEPFRKTFAVAQQFIEDGRPDELIVCRQPVPFVATARGFVEKYGTDDKYDIVRLLPRVACPVLILIGSRTLNASPAFDSLPDELSRLTRSGSRLELEVLDGEEMSYSLAPDRPFERLITWLEKLAETPVEPA